MQPSSSGIRDYADQATGVRLFRPAVSLPAGRAWIHRYQGRTGGGEMVSMGLQLLYQDARNLQLRDPELFDLLLDHLREP